MEDGKFCKIDETTAWNFQQGCMLQYGRNNPDLIFYNIYSDGDYRTVCLNTKTGQKQISERATAHIACDGSFGLSVNFSRIYDFRPGYGYCNYPDPYKDVPSPCEDGVFYVDFKTGKSRLLVSYAELAEKFPVPGKENAKFVVNHITLNPSGNRYLMLVRNFMEPGSTWGTSLYTGDLNGNVIRLATDTVFSHYWWTDDTHILAYASETRDSQLGFYVIEDITGTFSDRIAPEINEDLHCINDPVFNRYTIGDGYPHQIPYRRVMLLDNQTGISREICRALTVIPADVDIRCDLHNRWSRDGKTVTFDSTHRGRRDIVSMDISELYSK